MNERRRFSASVLLTVVLMALPLTACSVGSSVRLGWRETRETGHWQADFTWFDGTDMALVRATPGQSVRLALDAELTRGTLDCSLVAPGGGLLWHEVVDSTAIHEVAIPMVEDGYCTLRIVGTEAEGRFDLTWRQVEVSSAAAPNPSFHASIPLWYAVICGFM